MATLSKLLVELGLDSAGFAGGLGIATGALGKFGGGIKAIGGVIAGAAVLDGVRAIGTGLFDIGAQWDSVNDSIQTKTGASGAVLDGLANSAKKVFKEVPASMGDVGNAIATINQATGDTGPILEGVTKQAINLSKITGTDLNTNVAAATQAFKAWNVAGKDQGKTLDDLFTASQKSGASVATLSEQTAQYGPTLKNMGLSLSQSINFLGKLNKEGLDTGKVMAGMKVATANFAKAGVDSKTGLATVFNGIKNAKNAADAAKIAIKTFGSRAGPELARDILSGKLSLDDLTTAVDGSKDSINKTAGSTYDFAEKWQILKNNLTAALIPLGTGLFNALNALMPLFTLGAAGLTDLIAGIVGFVSAVTTAFNGTTSWTDLLTRVPGWLQPITLGLIEIVSGLGKLYRGFKDNGIQGFVDAFSAGWAQIRNGLGDLLGGIVGALGSIGSSLLDAFVGLPWGDIASAGWNLLVDAIKMDAKVAIKLGSLLVDVAGWLPGAIPDLWGWLTGHVFGASQGDGTGSSTGAGFGSVSSTGVTIPDLMVNLLAWTEGTIADLGAWLLPILVKSVQDLTNLGSQIASAVGDKLKSIDWKSAVTIDSANLGLVVGGAIHDALASAPDIALRAAQALFSLDWSAVPGQIGEGVKTALIGAGAVVAAIAIAIGSFIGGAIVGIVFGPDVDFGSVVTKIHDGIVAYVAGAAAWTDALPGKGQELLTGLRNGANAVWDNMVVWFNGRGAAATEAVGSLLSFLDLHGQELVTGLWNGANKVWDNFVVWGQTRGSQIVSAVGDLSSTLVATGKAVIAGLYGGAVDGWTLGGIYNWLQDRGSHIVSAIGDLSSLLNGVGASVVQGMADGISGAAWRVGNAIADIVSSIPGNIKSLLGISSPSKVMRDLLMHVPSGMALGMLDGINTVKDASARLGMASVPNMASVGSASYGVGAMAGSASSSSAPPMTAPITNNFYITESGNAKTTADEVFALFSRATGLKYGV